MSRGELFDLAWSTPISRLAERFGISDVALAKKCKKLGIPRPERGYWARVQHGWKGKKPKLPTRETGQPDSIRVDPKAEQPDKIENKPVELSKAILDEIEALRQRRNLVVAPSDFDGAHKYVKSSRRLLQAGKVAVYGQLYTTREGNCLSVYVGPESLDRTLLIFDAIIRTLEDHRFKIKLRNESGEKGTFIIRDGVEMKLSATEKSKRSDHIPTEAELKELKKYSWRTYPKWDYRPSGQIEIVLTRWPLNERRWKDLKSSTLEQQLTGLVIEIITSPERITYELAKREEERLRLLENKRLELVRRRRDAEEAERQKELVQHAEQWSVADKVRAYLAICAENLESSDLNDDQKEEWAEWIRWGREHADRIDPLKNGSQRTLMERTLNPPSVEVELYEVDWLSSYRWRA